MITGYIQPLKITVSRALGKLLSLSTCGIALGALTGVAWSQNTGITKRGNRELRLTNANTSFAGSFLIKQNPNRYLPTGFQTSGGQIEQQLASVALSGASGALANAARVEVTRSATLWLDNAAANNDNRINDLGVMDLKNGSCSCPPMERSIMRKTSAMFTRRWEQINCSLIPVPSLGPQVSDYC